MANGWKILGITLIIVLILENVGIYYVTRLGNDFIRMEDECSMELCIEYPLYHFDAVDNICSCFDEEEKLQYQEVLK